MPPISYSKLQLQAVLREPGIKERHVTRGLETRVAPLDEINRSGHGTQMNAFRGSPSLHVVYVGL